MFKINGELLHEEALLRIQLNGKIYSARSVWAGQDEWVCCLR